MSKIMVLLGALALLLAAPPALAAAERLDLPPGKAWIHPHSGISIPTTLGGVERAAAYRFEEDFLDVGILYETPDVEQSITVYIFRDTNGTVPVWFAQAQDALIARDIFEGFALSTPPTAFVPPGYSEASGLHAVYAGPEGAKVRSSGIAMFAADGWYVKIRATSETRDPGETSQWLMEIVGDIAVPEARRSIGAVAPVEDCAVPLALAPGATDAPVDMGGAMTTAIILSGAFIGDGEKDEAAATSEAGAAALLYCRDMKIAPAVIIYRPVDTDDRYLLAIGDNGRAIWAGPNISVGLLGGEDMPGLSGAGTYSVTYTTASEILIFPPQTGLPDAQRIIFLFEKGNPIASVGIWGQARDVKIYSDMFD